MLAAAPMAPATRARLPLVQSSLTRATPRAHSPPIPREAMKRRMAMCQASVANPQRPVKTA